jgi:inositol phosphorylceramide synthase catalytic subunit
LFGLARARALWGRWWILPFVPALFALALFVAPWGRVRPEHIALAVLCLLLGFWGPRTQRFLADIAPFVVVGLGYDLVRYARPFFVTEGRVLGCGLRQAELTLFGVGPNTTLGEFFAQHHTPALDLFFAVPYTVFVYVAFIYAAYLFFRDRPRMRRYLVSFAIANYISFACWLLIPAAPPWYLHTHGCAIDLSTVPSPAGLARVDELLGIQYFAGFYGRASSVFGAMPSMHCAYPLIGLLTAWRAARWNTRVLHIAYCICMASAALYLDHHWLLDAVGGWLTAFLAVTLADSVLARFPVATAATTPLPIGSAGLADVLSPLAASENAALRALSNQEQL